MKRSRKEESEFEDLSRKENLQEGVNVQEGVNIQDGGVEKGRESTKGEYRGRGSRGGNLKGE